MKKRLIIIVAFVFALCGCANIDKSNTIEEIMYFDIHYAVSLEKQDYGTITIDFETEDICVVYRKNSSMDKEYFSINDVEFLMDYINEMKNHPDNYNRDDHREQI